MLIPGTVANQLDFLFYLTTGWVEVKPAHGMLKTFKKWCDLFLKLCTYLRVIQLKCLFLDLKNDPWHYKDILFADGSYLSVFLFNTTVGHQWSPKPDFSFPNKLILAGAG